MLAAQDQHSHTARTLSISLFYLLPLFISEIWFKFLSHVVVVVVVVIVDPTFGRRRKDLFRALVCLIYLSTISQNIA